MQKVDSTVFAFPKSASLQKKIFLRSLRLIFSGRSQRMVREVVRKKARDDRQLRRAGAQPQRGT
jgi:hypothetical protein